MAPTTAPQIQTVAIDRLVRAAQRGDEAAWNEIVRRFDALVHGIGRSFRLNDADIADAAQATWFRLVQNLHRLNEPQAIGGWVTTTARRECLRLIERTDRAVPCETLPEVVDDAHDPHADLVAQERAALVRGALARLADRDQTLLWLLVSDTAPSYEEIAGKLGRPLGSIGPTRARALNRLRRELERDEATAELCR